MFVLQLFLVSLSSWSIHYLLHGGGSGHRKRTSCSASLINFCLSVRSGTHLYKHQSERKDPGGPLLWLCLWHPTSDNSMEEPLSGKPLFQDASSQAAAISFFYSMSEQRGRGFPIISHVSQQGFLVLAQAVIMVKSLLSEASVSKSQRSRLWEQPLKLICGIDRHPHAGFSFGFNANTSCCSFDLVPLVTSHLERNTASLLFCS